MRDEVPPLPAPALASLIEEALSHTDTPFRFLMAGLTGWEGAQTVKSALAQASPSTRLWELPGSARLRGSRAILYGPLSLRAWADWSLRLFPTGACGPSLRLWAVSHPTALAGRRIRKTLPSRKP